MQKRITVLVTGPSEGVPQEFLDSLNKGPVSLIELMRCEMLRRAKLARDNFQPPFSMFNRLKRWLT